MRRSQSYFLFLLSFFFSFLLFISSSTSALPQQQHEKEEEERGRGGLLEWDEDDLLPLFQNTSSSYVAGGSEDSARLILFYAPWCSHCKTLTPVLSQLAHSLEQDQEEKKKQQQEAEEEKEEEVLVGRVNAMQSPRLRLLLQLTAYPTLLYYKDGHYGHYLGSRSYPEIRNFVNRMKFPTFTTTHHYLPGSRREEKKEEEEEEESIWQAVARHHHENVTFVLSLPCHHLGGDCRITTGSGSESGGYGVVIDNFYALTRKFSLEAAFIVNLLPSTTTSSSSSHQEQSWSFCKYDLSLRSSVVSKEKQLPHYCLEDAKQVVNNLLLPPSPSSVEDDSKVVQFHTLFSSFINSVNYPMITHLENHNFHRLAMLNTTMIVAILSTSSPSLYPLYADWVEGQLRDVITSYERQGHLVDGKIVLGLLDQSRWHVFCKMHAIPTSPKPSGGSGSGSSARLTFLVMDHHDERYAIYPMQLIQVNQADDAQRIQSQLLDLLEGIAAETIAFIEKDHDDHAHQVTASLWKKMQSRWVRYQPWSWLVLLAPLLFAILAFFMPNPKLKND